MLYKIVVFLHVVFVFGFLLSHGASVSMAFALKRERDLQKIRVMLDLSIASYPLMGLTLLGTIVFGVIAAFQVNWWKFGWIWTSLVLLIVIVVLMAKFGAEIYGNARKAAGLPYKINGKPFPPEPLANDAELSSILEKSNPVLLTIIGYGGYAVITWLMMAKPF